MHRTNTTTTTLTQIRNMFGAIKHKEVVKKTESYIPF